MAANEERGERELPPGIVRSKTKAPSPADGRGEFPYTATDGASSETGAAFSDSPLPSAGEGAFLRKKALSPGVGPSENRITAIEPQQKRKNRVNIFIDGVFAAGLFDTVALDLGLRVGQAITPERLDEIAQAEILRRAKEDAYHLLSFRARSEKEITDRLAKKEYEPDVIARVVESLRASGLLDDEAFAQNWVSARGKTRGNRMLAHELRQKGVPSEVTAQTLGERQETDAEHTAAYQAAVKKVGEKPADTSREARAKVAAHLARRGFGWDIVKPVLARLYDKNGNDDETNESAE